MTKAITARIFDISRGTTHDGPGLRTTIFLQGCTLECLWCQNPESISVGPQISWEASKCIGCHRCINVCKSGALSEGPDGSILRDKNICVLCGACVEACPSKAMEFISREWTLHYLVREALKDLEYYRAFGGGVTVSGGEPLLQHKFVRAFFNELKNYNIHTALDTCGMASDKALKEVLEFTDLVLFDIKFMDDMLHRKYTGQSNKVIFNNLEIIAQEIRNQSLKKGSQSTGLLKLWIRTPLIPGATARKENLSAIGAYIKERLADVVERWELCAFNKACISKYQKLGLEWEFKDTQTMKQIETDELRESAISEGFDKEKVLVSGLTTN